MAPALPPPAVDTRAPQYATLPSSPSTPPPSGWLPPGRCFFLSLVAAGFALTCLTPGVRSLAPRMHWAPRMAGRTPVYPRAPVTIPRRSEFLQAAGRGAVGAVQPANPAAPWTGRPAQYELDAPRDEDDDDADGDNDEDGAHGEEGVAAAVDPEERRRRRREWSRRLRPSLVAKAQAVGFVRPTSVQRRAIPTILAGRDVVIHAETGAGKTLAFLMPLLQRVQPDLPFQALVICPSSELAVQTAQVLTRIWDLEGNAVGLVVAGTSPAAQYQGLQRKQPAVIVGAASQLDYLLEDADRREALLRNVRTVVLDEVDALLPPRPTDLIEEVVRRESKKAYNKEEDFKEKRRLQRKGFTFKDVAVDALRGKERRLLELKPAQRLLDYLNLHKPRMQLIGASATAQPALVNFLSLRAKKYDSFLKIKVVSSRPAAPLTKGLRSRGVAGVGVPSRIRHRMLINKDADTNTKLANVLEVYNADAPWSVLMAVGNTESVAGWVEKLRFRGIAGAAPLHELLGFGGEGAAGRADPATLLARHRALQERFANHTGERPFVVTTQATCRGIDLKGVDAVYLTALPKDTDEYQHLAGRSGREGRTGKVVSFFDQREVLAALQFKRDLGIKMAVAPEELIPRYSDPEP